MTTRRTARIGTLAARRIRLASFLVPFLIAALAVSGLVSSGHAQQAGDALQQLQQMRGGQGGIGNQPAVPQDVLIQPVQTDNRTLLPQSRLEQIMSSRAGAPLQQFGYDQLGSGRAIVVPQTGAVQDDYVLGPNDEIVVTLRGQENNEYRTVVDRNGQVVLPRLNPISATGRSFGSFRQDVDAAVRRAYVATNAFVSIGRTRQISVLVSGEVNNPGQRLVTGLSTTVDALLLSGGVKKTGSLRNVRILRGGRTVMVDLYGVLTGRAAASQMSLADGDRIVVPPLGPTVAVSGLVRQPGIFELPARSGSVSVSALLSLAGGQEVRGQYRLSVLRILPDGRSDLQALSGQGGIVRDSEILFVQLGAQQTTGQATLSGGVGLAGAYPIIAGTKLSEILRAPGALGASPYTLFGVIVRRDPHTLLKTLVPFTPVAVLAGKEDLALQSDDLVRPISVDEAKLLTFVTGSFIQKIAISQSQIRNPLGAQSVGGDNLAKAVSESVSNDNGSFDVSAAPANIQLRTVLELLDTAPPGSALEHQQTLYNADKADQQALVVAQLQAQQGAQGQGGAAQAQRPGQPGALAAGPAMPQQPGALAGQGGAIQPQFVTNPDGTVSPAPRMSEYDASGNRSAARVAPNFADQSVSADQFASNREAQTLREFSRQLGMDPLALVNFMIEHRARLDGAVRAPGYYFVGPSVALGDLVQAGGGTSNWVDGSNIELITSGVDRQTGRSITTRQSVPLAQATLASFVVHPRDQLRFGSVQTDVRSGAVTVQGEVRNPGIFPILRGEHLSDVLARAGGLTNVAYPSGAVFLRVSAAEAERAGYVRAASEIQDQLVVAMSRIGNDKLDPNTFTALQAFVTELRNQRALGRMVVTADPSLLAADRNRDVLLEPGDVLYIPQRPATVAVLGQVLQPGNYPYSANQTVAEYVDRAGGYSQTANESQTFIVLPDGSARRIERSWLSFSANSLPPGSSIVIPRDVTPLDLRQTIIDVSQIFSQFAVSIASIAVLAKQ